MDTLTVQAQGTHIHNDDRLILAVDVRNAAGDPVLGLAEGNIKVWELGHFFSSMSSLDVIELGASIPELAGMYHVVRKEWSGAANGTFAFRVRISDRKQGVGSALAWVVKTG